jgi:hypothetical protein
MVILKKIVYRIVPLECNRTQYTLMLSSSLLNGAMYIDSIKNNSKLASDFVTKPIEADLAKNSIAKVNIYYASLSYTYSTESPYLDLLALLGSIGGTLGLFMGISILSISEIVEVLLEIYFISIKTKITINK